MSAPKKTNDSIVFDFKSARSYDADGRLHVALSNISKANVCPYFGEEIPEFEALGLDPKKKYMLYRDPDELAKGAATSNGIQLLSIHIPVSADEPQKEVIAGTTGTDAVFNAPYLQNSLVIWDAEDIKNIENESVKELSCGYRYRPDMTPGTADGEAYDGVMRDIIFNHVALVKEGRAGSDVVVSDAKPLTLENHMSKKKALSNSAVMVKGALLAHLRPVLAADKMPKLDEVLLGVKSSKWKEQKAEIAAAIKPKLAKDADIEGVIKLLDKLDGDMPDDDLGVDDDDMAATDADNPDSALLEKIIAAIKGCMTPAKAADEPPAGGANNDPKNGKDKEEIPGAKDADKDMKDMVDKKAMDAAIENVRKETETSTIKRLQGISEATDHVQPYVGKLAVTMDSAESVYKAALDIMKIDINGVHPSAYKAVLLAQPKPGEGRKVTIVQDGAPPSDFAEMFPTANRLIN